MSSLIAIIAISSAIWIVIDRIKFLWKKLSWGKWVTIGMAFLAAIGAVFSYDLDLFYAAGLCESAEVVGQIITAIAIASGSSTLAEVVGYLKSNKVEAIDLSDIFEDNELCEDSDEEEGEIIIVEEPINDTTCEG